MQNDKVRIYHVAHELDMESKALLDLCRQHGIDVKNQLSTLSLEKRDAIMALVRKMRKTAPADQNPPATANTLETPISRTAPQPIALPAPESKLPGQPPRKLPAARQPSAKPQQNQPTPEVKPIPAPVAASGTTPPKAKASEPLAAQTAADGSALEEVSALERLCSLGKSLQLASIKRLPGQHPEDAIKSLGKCLEVVVEKAAEQTLGSKSNDHIKALLGRMTRKAQCFVNQVRILANIAKHAEEDFFPEDVNHAAHALASVLEEMTARKLLTGVK